MSYQRKAYRKQGGDELVIASGGSLDVESGGAFKIAGTTVTASAAELNYNDITTLGTSQASKAVTADANGAVAITGRLTTTDGVASGTSRVVGGRAYTNTAASAAITNTTNETVFDTRYTIPANTLKAGTLVKVRFQGIATATNSTDTLTIKLYLATDTTAGAIVGTALLSLAATDVTNNDVFQGEYELIVRTAGASGTMVGVGTYKSIPDAEGTMTVKDDILASTTVDTTAAQIVCCAATWSVASASNSCRLDFLRVEIY